MRSAFLTGLILGVCILFATAQESITIHSDRNDLSRPISTLINQIRHSEKISVTYEDPRYANALDMEDVTAEVSKGAEVEKTYGPRILVPKGHPITFVYASESKGESCAPPTQGSRAENSEPNSRQFLRRVASTVGRGKKPSLVLL